MSTHDDDRDAEMTTDWPGTGPIGQGEDGEATAVVPKSPQRGAPPPPSPPQRPALPPMSPPQSGQFDAQWHNAPQSGAPPSGAWMPPATGPYPPGYPPSPPIAAQPRKGARWGLIAAGAIALVAATVAATMYFTRGGGESTPAAAPQPSTSAPATATAGAPTSEPTTTAASPPVSPTPTAAAGIDPAALKGLLASVPEINQLIGTSTMTPSGDFDAPFTGVTVDPFSCTSAVTPGDNAVYGGSGLTGFAGQVLADATQENKVIQSIASFTTAAAAKAFFDKQFAAWEACKFTDITLDTGADTVGQGTLSVAANADGTAKIFIFPPAGGPGRQCEHAMTPRQNVVVDVRVCAPSVGSMGWTLARDIGQKITGRR